MKYEWLLFDLDNTLLDFDQSERSALDQALVDFGISPNETIRQTYKTINEDCGRLLKPESYQKRNCALNVLRFSLMLGIFRQIRYNSPESTYNI